MFEFFTKKTTKTAKITKRDELVMKFNGLLMKLEVYPPPLDDWPEKFENLDDSQLEYLISQLEGILKEQLKHFLLEQVDKYPSLDNWQKNIAHFTDLEILNDFQEGIANYRKDDREYTEHRRTFIEYLLTYDIKPIAENLKKGRPSEPEKATISMRDLIGDEGVKLYQLALEEERYSMNFMQYVFASSLSQFEGEKWAEKPIILIAGPSASGKSYVAPSIIDESNKYLQKEQDKLGNEAIFVDGGKIREASQMRKLIIQMALLHGFTGIQDLHDQSSVLESVKATILNVALKAPYLGVIIPETFSGYINPNDDCHQLLQQAYSVAGAKVIFSRVTGVDKTKFKDVVSLMGSRRAWKTERFNNLPPLNLNIEASALPESKEYYSKGFYLGYYGSILAERYVTRQSPHNIVLVIANDLVNHIMASSAPFLISERTLTQWHNDTDASSWINVDGDELTKEKFLPYARNNPTKPLIFTPSAYIFFKAQGDFIREYHLLATEQEIKNHLEPISEILKKMDINNSNEIKTLIEILPGIIKGLEGVGKPAEKVVSILKRMQNGLNQEVEHQQNYVQEANIDIKVISNLLIDILNFSRICAEGTKDKNLFIGKLLILLTGYFLSEEISLENKKNDLKILMEEAQEQLGNEEPEIHRALIYMGLALKQLDEKPESRSTPTSTR